MAHDWELLVDGLDFGEGPRWHDGALWYSDFYQHAIYTVTADGERAVAFADLPDRPSGLGWMPDGTLLAVFMTSRRVMRDDGSGSLVEHADLSAIATGHCNDMVVDRHGNAYVGNFGFDLEAEAKAKVVPADLALVRPDGSVSVAARGLRFPNGAVITPDEATLVVGETFGAGYVAFDIGDDATLGDARPWATIEGSWPDGCVLDTAGGIWFADARGSQLVRVLEGGQVTDRVPTPMPTYACTLGGPDGTTLYAMCATRSRPREITPRGGAIYRRSVEHAHAGRP